jgi:hypothetical protein
LRQLGARGVTQLRVLTPLLEKVDDIRHTRFLLLVVQT